MATVELSCRTWNQIGVVYKKKSRENVNNEAVSTGHNVLILWATGTGRRSLVKKIFQKSQNRKYTQLTVSTGIAASPI